MHHLTLLVFFILLAIVAGEELVHLFFSHVAEALAWLAVLLLAIGGFYLACFAAYPLWVLFCDLVGHARAIAIIDPLLVLAVFGIPLFVIVDSYRDFAWIGAAFHAVWTLVRWPAGVGCRWWCRYRVMNAYNFPESYAPWLWLARHRAAHVPGHKIQQRRP